MERKNEHISLGFALLNCLAGPAKAGSKWVTYSRAQVDAMIEAAKKIMAEEGSK